MRTRIIVIVLGLLVLAPDLYSQTPDIQAKFRLAQALEQAGDYERAVELYRELYTRDPQNLVFFDALHRLSMQLKQYDDAVAIIQSRLKQHPGDISLLGMLGTAYYRAGQEREAFDGWEQALEEGGANPQAYRAIATILIENRLLDRAAEVYRRARAACNDPKLFSIELAQLLAASMDYAGATDEYLRWLSQNPAQLGFVQNRMAAYSWKADGRAAAVAAVRKALAGNEELRLFELLAWLYTEGKEFPQALEIYRRIDELSRANGTALLGFADRVYRDGAFAIAAQAYAEALEHSLPVPRVPQARYGQACALKEIQVSADSAGGLFVVGSRPVSEAQTRYAGAIASFLRISADYPRTEYAARSLYQIGLIQLRQYADRDQALRTFEDVLAAPALLPAIRHDVQLRRGEILLARADTTGATQAFRDVVAAPNATPDQSDEAQFRLAEIDFFAGRFDAAVNRLSQISLNLQNDYANDALQLQAFLQENTATAPEALVQFGKAEFLARQGKITEATALLNDIVRRYPQTALIDDALFREGSLLTGAGMFLESIAIYERLLGEFKDRCRLPDYALFRLGEVYQFGLKDTAQAIAAYEKLLADQPTSVLANEARKRIRLLRGDSL